MPSTSASSAARKRPARPAPLTPRKPVARSRVSNGKDILPGCDGRSQVARRYRDICAALASDQGGADRMSEARVQLCRRFAAAACIAEAMEAELANGRPIDIAEHSLLSSTLVRLASRIGINRTAREIVPTLREYIEIAEPA
jgi:hypothetical protein